jgi:DNA-binding NarL/FixJ family response regulator
MGMRWTMISTGSYSPRSSRRIAAPALDEIAPRPAEHSRRARPDQAATVRLAQTVRPCAPRCRLDRLSPREREVLHLLTFRYADREIADALCISYRTVTTHVAHILNKLGVNSRREAAALLFSHSEC